MGELKTFVPSNIGMIACANESGAYVRIEDYKAIVAERDALKEELAKERKAYVYLDAENQRLREGIKEIIDTERGAYWSVDVCRRLRALLEKSGKE